MKKMNYMAVLLLGAAVSPLAAQAQDQSYFSRGRDTPVADRTPKGYEAVSVHAGAFDVAPKLDTSLESNDNIYYSPKNKVSDLIWTVAPSLVASSGWRRHALVLKVGAVSNNYSSKSKENTTSYDLGVGGRIDVHGDSNLFGGFDLSKNYEPRFNPDTPKVVAKPIRYDATVGNLGFVAVANRLRFTGRVDYQKLNYFDARSNVGNLVIDQDFRDYAVTTPSGRAEYAVSPDTSVYLALSSNVRAYTLAKSRGSHGTDVSIGTSFDITKLIQGEVQVGTLHQKYKNGKTTNGTSANVRVQYFPTLLTTVTVTGSRSVQETPDATSSGYLAGAAALSVDHEVTRTLVASASINHFNNNYVGSTRRDNGNGVTVGTRYFVNHNVVLKAGLTHSEFKSTGSTIGSYKDNALKVSIGLQY